jgi:hypothetical protein
MLAPAAYDVPKPLETVFQSVKAWPRNVGVGNVNGTVPKVKFTDAGATAPPSTLKTSE